VAPDAFVRGARFASRADPSTSLRASCVRPYVILRSRIDGYARGFGPLGLIPELEIVMAEAGNSGGDARPSPRPNPNEKLVKVFDSEDESEALVVKGLLDSAGIDSDLASASLLQDAFPGLGGVLIQVREEDAEAARRLIAEQLRSAAEDDVTAEISIIEEPPPKG
jgi:hypothetical protein